jgi:ferritin-like protein
MTFEEWMKYNNYSLKGMDEHEAEFLMREAWNYQQKRINLLEQRIIDLQGHDDLSYIDRKLSEQEEVMSDVFAKKKQIYEDKDAAERRMLAADR